MTRAALAAVALVTVGCAHRPSSYMRPVAAAAPAACARDASVVFVRPTRIGDVHVDIREEDGTYIGRLEDETYFRASVSPGRHLFVAYATGRTLSRPVALEADLLPGQTYYVDVELYYYFPALFAVAPRLKYWDELDGWLARSRWVERDPALGEPGLPGDWAAVVAYVREAREMLKGRPRGERTLEAGDGTTGGHQVALASGDDEACVVRAVSPKRIVVTQPPPVNPAKDPDLPRCWWQMTTGTHIRQQVCKIPRNALSEHESYARDILVPRGGKK